MRTLAIWRSAAKLAAGLTLIAISFCAVPALAQSSGPAAAAPAKPLKADYNDPDNWLCRPGKETLCETNLDAMEVTGDGKRTYQKFVPASYSPIDCFYVYPTVSHQTTDYSDFNQDPELEYVVRNQAARLTAHCRMFAPIYRQLTLPGLERGLKAGKNGLEAFDPPYRDVLAAWKHYLKNNNHGRGVVLVGHSQGTIILQKLIAQEIDGKPIQSKLVAAFLAGDPSLPVPQGKLEGGVFKHIPLCDHATETGCVYVWGSFLAGENPERREFGRSPGNGLVGACVSPAAPGGGSAELKAYVPRPAYAPQSDPPFVEMIGQLSGECVTDSMGSVLRVTILPSRFAEGITTSFTKGSRDPSWGLHRLDMNLEQGNIVDLIGIEAKAWAGK
jgi:hypothetical protein